MGEEPEVGGLAAVAGVEGQGLARGTGGHLVVGAQFGLGLPDQLDQRAVELLGQLLGDDLLGRRLDEEVVRPTTRCTG